MISKTNEKRAKKLILFRSNFGSFKDWARALTKSELAFLLSDGWPILTKDGRDFEFVTSVKNEYNYRLDCKIITP